MDSPGAPDAKLGRRKHPRLRLGISARLITTGAEYAVRLDNLSATGAFLSGRRQQSFKRCVLKWLEYEAWGALVWGHGGYCGVCFESPLPEEWIANTREQSPHIPEEWKLPTSSRVRFV